MPGLSGLSGLSVQPFGTSGDDDVDDGILQENGDYLLQENGDYLLQE